jgi:hypothetical protein
MIKKFTFSVIVVYNVQEQVVSGVKRKGVVSARTAGSTWAWVGNQNIGMGSFLTSFLFGRQPRFHLQIKKRSKHVWRSDAVGVVPSYHCKESAVKLLEHMLSLQVCCRCVGCKHKCHAIFIVHHDITKATPPSRLPVDRHYPQVTLETQKEESISLAAHGQTLPLC